MQTLIVSVLNRFFAQLAFSDEYISEYRKALEARGKPTKKTQPGSAAARAKVGFLFLIYFSFYVCT